MKKKPELVTSAASLEQIERYLRAGADAFVIGESKYGMRLPGDVTVVQLAEAVKLTLDKARIYVAMNNVMDNATVDTLPEYIQAIANAGVHGIVFGDPAVLRIARQLAPHLALHWNAEMTSTNYATANYWGRRGATRFVLARELNLEQVIEAKANTNLEVQVHVHGLTNIYHSKRELVESYGEFVQAGELDANQARGLYLIETERPNERFPIYEDANGTHIMSSDDVCMLEYLHELLVHDIDSYRVEPLLKSVEYNETVLRAYRNVIDQYYESTDADPYEFDEQLLETVIAMQQREVPERELSFGFFFKEQVY